jgi:hypothetical protein
MHDRNIRAIANAHRDVIGDDFNRRDSRRDRRLRLACSRRRHNHLRKHSARRSWKSQAAFARKPAP